MSRTNTVLIAEDDPVFRRVISFTLARCGLRVETAGDGSEAYDRVCRGGIGFLVTDLQMPVCDGLELIERLDAHADFRRPPTVLCTAKGFELDAVALIRQKHLLAIMHKPFSPKKLSDLILREIDARTTEASEAISPGEGSIGRSADTAACPVVTPATDARAGTGLPPTGLSNGAVIDE
jgi:CheY-like chemotaxis protein